jgi:hypothetical protein
MKANKSITFRALPLAEFAQLALQETYESFLFNTNRHLLLQKNPNVWVFWAEQNQKILARCNIFLNESVGYSPWRMSFGGIEFCPKLSYEVLHNFVVFLTSFCKQELQLQKLHIKQYPFSYTESNSHLLTQILLQNGFSVQNQELTQYIQVNQPFEENLHLSEKRRLQKALKAEFVVEWWQNPDWKQVFTFVAEARKRRSFPLTMNETDFYETVATFPEKYSVFVVKKNAEIVALTVGVKVSRKVFYNFYPADNPSFLSYSPMVLLTKGLVDFCKEQSFEILDLGISTENGKANTGLIRFKKNLGSQNALKLSFVKILD